MLLGWKIFRSIATKNVFDQIRSKTSKCSNKNGTFDVNIVFTVTL